MKKLIEDAIKTALKAMSVEPMPAIEIEIPRDESHGDISTPVAMGLAKRLKKPPKEIAADILKHMPAVDFVEKAEVAGPGHINFTLTRGFLFDAMRTLLREGPVIEDLGGGRSVQVEFVSANPTGPLHLGHGRGAAVGGALANLLERGGYAVTREYYINDAGRQVRLLAESVFARYRELCGAEYPFPEDGYRGDYVIDIAKALRAEVGDRYRDAAYAEAGAFITEFSLRMMLLEIEKDLEDFGIRFDSWQTEKGLYSAGEVAKMINHLKGKGLMYEHEGALWFRASVFGDEKDRVVVKSDGEYTYFASDIAYHMKKIEGGYEELIDVWGADHHGYIPRVQAVIDAFGYGRERLVVVLVQMVSLMRGGKPVPMSKRAGEFITLREIMDEVGADTTKFIFLTRRPDSHLVFDIEAAKAASAENPVYYVQYANARINSIFAHARDKGVNIEDLHGAPLKLLTAPEEIRLIKKLLSYTMTLEAAVRAREPHRITFHLQELAGLFHPYYNAYRVVTDDAGLSAARLALCEAIRSVLRDGLRVLGISAPERMIRGS